MSREEVHALVNAQHNQFQALQKKPTSLAYEQEFARTSNQTKEGLVQELRKIREAVSAEIKDMTFEQERAYLDELLKNSGSP